MTRVLARQSVGFSRGPIRQMSTSEAGLVRNRSRASTVMGILWNSLMCASGPASVFTQTETAATGTRQEISSRWATC